MIRTIAIVLAFLVPAAAPAQQRECATEISPAQAATELERLAAGPELLRTPPVTTPYHIPLTIHIVRRTNGTGGFRLDQLDTAMADINRLYVPAGIRFFIHGAVRYIDNDVHFTIPDDQVRRDALRILQVVPNTINVYFTNLDSLCGQSSFPADPIQGVLIDNDCAGSAANPSSFAHEVGHYLNLYHTHETSFGTECPSGINCLTAGDLLCDTPADPDLSGRVTTACAYNNSAPPPAWCGVTPYAPLPDNIMSYARKTCRDAFTQSQISRMLTALEGSRSSLHTLVRYVDVSWNGIQAGTAEFPFRTVGQAVTAVPAGGRIAVRSGIYPENPTVTKQLTIDRWNTAGQVRLGQ